MIVFFSLLFRFLFSTQARRSDLRWRQTKPPKFRFVRRGIGEAYRAHMPSAVAKLSATAIVFFRRLSLSRRSHCASFSFTSFQVGFLRPKAEVKSSFGWNCVKFSYFSILLSLHFSPRLFDSSQTHARSLDSTQGLLFMSSLDGRTGFAVSL